jgi:UDP-N-acetylmuramoyl-L-alanyl-D-glutamate--2,6-diaminopimelate ligase
MLLSRLAQSLADTCTLAPQSVSLADHVEIRRASFDSREVQAGDLYCALPGARTDGRQYLAEAKKRGAVAVLHIGGVDPQGLPELRVNLGCKVASEAGRAAALLAGRPSDELLVAAITGTNGKSTVVHLLQQAWQAASVPAGRVGTLGFAFGPQNTVSLNTTPRGDQLQHWLAQIVAQGARAVAVEASSHGIDQGRLGGLEVDLVGWTNLSHDHLDYHHTLQAYAEAKAKLVHGLSAAAYAFIPAHDARVHAAIQGAACQFVGFSLEDQSQPLHGQYQTTPEGLQLKIGGDWGQGVLRSQLVGRHNGENLLLAYGLLRASGISTELAIECLQITDSAPGRLQRIAGSSPWFLFVDYAHTPDALIRVLSALRESYPDKRLGIVCGAGGDRDPIKRAPMGRAAAEGSDWCMLTSDNPRSEDPQAILELVAQGAAEVGKPLHIQLDRRQAIREAVQLLNSGDILLVAGKGHEPYQEIDGVRYPFDDCEVLQEAVNCYS